MSEIVLKNVKKSYDQAHTVIEDLNLVIKSGSFTVLVGPSGCGKSTTLRMIAGLEEISEGELYIDGELMNNVEPGNRDIAMVFQNYALYPTMSVRGNIEFGLINAKVPKETRDELIDEITEIVGLKEYLDKKPSQLSGGQRQRVALARAMVKKPKVFLMDEPLSNLDAKLRNQMRSELIELHHRLKTTFVYVTHDQTEALSMATDIVLMEKGKIRQHDSAQNIYNHPKNIFTAQFIGTPEMNIIDRHKIASQLKLSQDVGYIGFRPSKVKFIDQKYESKANDFKFKGQVITREMLGSEIIYRMNTDFGVINVKAFSDTDLQIDDEVELVLAYDNIHFFDQNKESIETMKKLKPYLFIAPALIIFLIFSIYPIFNMIGLSFYEWDFISPTKVFVGFKNYVNLFKDAKFFQTLTNTIVYMVLTVGIGLILGIFLALFLNKNTKVNKFMQSIIFSPYIVSLASVSFLWMWLMNTDFGLINYILSIFNIPAIDWLGSPKIALFSLVIISVWKTLGYNTIIILSALQSIPKYLYEAASLDRANKKQVFFKITLPMISPTLFFLTIVNIIASFKVFDTIQIITQGGPQNSTNTLVYSLYEYGFKFYKIGYASTIGVVLLVIIAVFTVIYFKLLSKKVHYQ